MTENPQDIELEKELEKIDWQKFIAHGTVEIQVRFGEYTLLSVKRTYPKKKP